MKYCPSCHDEFEDDSTNCQTCEVGLVSQLPEETDKDVDYFDPEKPVNDYSEMEKVFTGTLFEAEIIKGCLESSNIEAIIDGAELASSVGLPVEPGAGLEQVSVLVKQEDYDKANEVLEDAQSVTEEELARAADGKDYYPDDIRDEETDI